MQKQPNEEGITFFGEVDRNSKGQISSEYPAWYFEQHLENLGEEISKMQYRIDNGLVHPTKMNDDVQKLKKQKERYDAILSSKPKIKGATKDKMAKIYEELGGAISESFFTESEMKLGLANPHEEAKRMVEYKIKVPPELAEAMGVRTIKGCASRNGAAKMWKILGRALDGHSNTGYLKRDRSTFRTGD